MTVETSASCISGASAFGALGIAIGYAIRLFIANRTSSRKEDWDQLQDLTQQANELVDEALGYFCTKQETAEERRTKAIKIQGMIRASGQQAYALSKALRAPLIETYQKRLRQVITGNGFDADHTKEPLEPNDPKIGQIERACGSLVGALQMQYMRQYRSNRVS